METIEFGKRMHQRYEALVRFGKKLADTLKSLFQAIHNAFKKIWELCWQAYKDHGMPHGTSDEGMLRWLKEICEIARMKSAIEREIAWREGLERLRIYTRIA